MLEEIAYVVCFGVHIFLWTVLVVVAFKTMIPCRKRHLHDTLLADFYDY